MTATALVTAATFALSVVYLPIDRDATFYLAPFPGAAALLPCLGAAAIIWAGSDGHHPVGDAIGAAATRGGRRGCSHCGCAERRRRRCPCGRFRVA